MFFLSPRTSSQICLSVSLSLSEGWFSSQLWPAEGGSGDPGGERDFPEGPRAQGRRTPHRRGLQDQREGLRGLPGDRVQRGAIAERGRREDDDEGSTERGRRARGRREGKSFKRLLI